MKYILFAIMAIMVLGVTTGPIFENAYADHRDDHARNETGEEKNKQGETPQNETGEEKDKDGNTPKNESENPKDKEKEVIKK